MARHTGIHDFDSLGTDYDPRVSGYTAAIGERGIMTDGTVLLKNGAADTAWVDASTVLVPPTSPPGNPLLFFGAKNDKTGTYTAYFPVGAADAASARPGLVSTTDDLSTRIIMTRSGTLKNAFVAQTTAAGAAHSVTYTVLLNGVDSGIVIVLAGAGSGAGITTGNDTTHTAAVVAGDQVSAKIVGASASAAGLTTMSLEYA